MQITINGLVSKTHILALIDENFTDLTDADYQQFLKEIEEGF